MRRFFALAALMLLPLPFPGVTAAPAETVVV